MKLLSDNILTLILAVLLGLAPIQSIAASVSECMDTNMHKQMKVTDHVMKMDMSKTADTSDCCNHSDSECGTSHCAGVTAAVINSNNIDSITYRLGFVEKKAKLILISFLPSSLYRPPKV